MMVRNVAVALLACFAAGSAHAQDGVDWGGMMGTIAQGSAMEEAAREGAGSAALSKRADPNAKPGRNASIVQKCAYLRRRLDRLDRAGQAKVSRLCGWR